MGAPALDTTFPPINGAADIIATKVQGDTSNIGSQSGPAGLVVWNVI